MTVKCDNEVTTLTMAMALNQFLIEFCEKIELVILGIIDKIKRTKDHFYMDEFYTKILIGL